MVVCIVTGCSRGIGRAVVELILSQPDTHVMGCARSKEPLEELQSRFGKDRFQFICGDITNPSLQDQLINLTVTQFKRINSVVLNHGVLSPVNNVTKFKLAQWQEHYQINFFSNVSLVSKCLPFLEISNGNIIAVSSGASVKPYYGWSAYCSSKAALNSFIASIALEINEVTTISIAPGVVDTQMQNDIRNVYGPQSMTNESLKRFKDLHDNGELLPPEIPGEIYAKLAIKGIPKNLNGVYLRYNDPRLNYLDRI